MTRLVRQPRRVVIAIVAFLLFAGFVALGTWQLQRRTWKLDLIERVDQRVHAPAVAAPGPDAWPRLGIAADEYRRVQASGSFVNEAETFVQAVTERGAGFWVLTPLKLADSSVLLINRGFVPPEARERVAHVDGPVTVTGLLRISEPGGGFLRDNDAAANRWYSRDVQAIATARGLARVAPYFIDADATPSPGSINGIAPVGGLTVTAFHNSHLVYAITWYTLALMVAAAAWRFMREEPRAEF
ncbi:MAG: SURF1 family protein [Burkholderiales bacterium]